ncbi:MAG: Crp/Fnr family transcriptional regulator [Bacteroidota bacterium]|nr:Crp/Fnr family transcriptional regulator [Bacteroidota bacterium]
MSNSCDVCFYRSFLFDNLEKKELALLSLSRKEINYKKGEIIMREGEKISDFIYLKEGLLKVYRTVSYRKEQIVGVAKPMDFVGLLSVFSKSNYQYSLSTLEDSAVCIIPLDLVRQMVHSNGEFASTLLEKMSKMNDQILNTRLDINLKNLRGRTAYILLMFSKEVYKSEKFDLPVSRKEIGELIDMRTENVIRILSEFRNDEIIKIEGKGIEIVDMVRLEQISEFG